MRKVKKMKRNKNENNGGLKIGQSITINCQGEQVIIDKMEKKALIWLDPQSQVEISFDELEYDVSPSYPKGIKEILTIFENPVGVIVKSKRKKVFSVHGKKKRTWLYSVSRKEFLKKELENVVIGETYFVPIYSFSPWGVFVKIGNLIALCHCTEVSRAKIYDLQNYFKIGEKIKVKVVSKETYADYYRISVSRKQTETPAEKYIVGDLVDATITSRLNYDSYFCEINPAQKGIYHVTGGEKLKVGQKVYGVLTKIEPEGLRLRELFSEVKV